MDVREFIYTFSYSFFVSDANAEFQLALIPSTDLTLYGLKGCWLGALDVSENDVRLCYCLGGSM